PQELIFAKGPEDGKWYAQARSDHVLYNGHSLEPGKWYEVSNTEYFGIKNGDKCAYFQFEAPQTPMVKMEQSPMGYRDVNIYGQHYVVSAGKASGMPEDFKGEVISASANPRAQGRVSVILSTFNPNNPNARGSLCLDLSPTEAMEMGIRLRPDGSFDPQNRGLLVGFTAVRGVADAARAQPGQYSPTPGA